MTQTGFPTTELREEHERGVPGALVRLERLIQLSRNPIDGKSGPMGTVTDDRA